MTRNVLLVPVTLPPSSPFSFPLSLPSFSLRQPEAIFRGVVEVVETVERLVDVGCITKADLVRAREGGGVGGGEGKVGWRKDREGEAGERETGCLTVGLTNSRSKLSWICLSAYSYPISRFPPALPLPRSLSRSVSPSPQTEACCPPSLPPPPAWVSMTTRKELTTLSPGGCELGIECRNKGGDGYMLFLLGGRGV